MFEKAKWIWISKESVPNERAEFFFTARVEGTPEDAIVRIGCETKYELFVNGTLAVFDGGLFRESLPGRGYFDEADITRFLKAGKNEIAVSVRYFGNGGRNNSYCEKPGLIFECEKLSLYSDERVPCKRAEGYYDTESENPSYLYGGHNTAYNAQKQAFSACPLPGGTAAATVLGNYGDAPWGELEKRPVPLFFFTEKKTCTFTRDGDKAEIKLPYAMHCSPRFKVKAKGGEKIDIRTDRYAVNGGPGDSGVYYGHRAEYICAAGEQEFEVFDWFFGEKILFTIPESVEIVSLGYRESGYPARVTGTFECDDPAINRLYEKCVRTLLVCMRENFMDCPDRERGQWIGDVSVQAPQVVYILDENARKLLKKAIFDFIDLRKGNRLVGNVPGDNYSELPAQSLNAISELGMIAVYYAATEDVTVLEKYFRPAAEYLKLWDTDECGVVTERQGDWKWYDHLFNIDGEILNQCWYYSALKFARRSADILGDHAFDAFFEERMKAIEDNFEKRYWQGAFYSSGKAVDDRANAMAVLSGLCGKEHYGAVRFVLNEVRNASTYMEGYVLSALCEMGFGEDAFYRMKSRYCNLIENENSTLWEDFACLGTKNHAWSGAPAAILFRYFAGVTLHKERTETDCSPLKYIKCSYEALDGEKVVFGIGEKKGRV